MQSAGNDIIALGTINSQRSKDSRFYTKILSVSEQGLYPGQELVHISFEQFLWLAWSVKESAYKYLKRGLPDLVFSPTRIIIQHIDIPVDGRIKGFENGQWEGNAGDQDCYRGFFTFNSSTFYFRSKIHAELIATVVSENENFEHVWWGIRSVDHTDTDHQSKEVRSFLLHKLNTVFPGKDLRITGSPLGYPVVWEGKKEWEVPVSFAHHDRFIAYSFLLGCS